MANPNMRAGAPSVNPKGRPKKARAMTTLLERAGSHTLDLADGRHISGKRWLALSVWELLTKRTVTLPDGSTMSCDEVGWFDVAKWVYAQVDGPPPQAIKLGNMDGETLEIGLRAVDYRAGLDALAPRPVSDSDASGEDQDSGGRA